MKRFLSILVLFFFSLSLSMSSIDAVVASVQDITVKKEKIKIDFGKLQTAVYSEIETLKKKETDSTQKAHIVKKQQEILSYNQTLQQQVSKAYTQSQLDKIYQDAKKRIELKALSAKTKYQDIAKGIPSDVQKDKKRNTQARELLKKTISKNTQLRFVFSSTKVKKEVYELLSPYDTDIIIDELFEKNQQYYYQIESDKKSILSEELLNGGNDINIPSEIFGFPVVPPEIFTIEDIQGEDTSTTWGINKYGISKYIAQIPHTGDPISVAVIDTGVDSTHGDLTQNVALGYDFVNDDTDPSDDQGHGTHVAGTIAAAYNHEGIVGVNPYAQIVPLKICDSSGLCPSYAILNALKYVQEHHIPVVNMSLGGRGNPQDNPICGAISAVTASGTIVVVAAGNSNVDASTFVPGGCHEAITVGAVDATLTKASFSNYGQKIDVSAPGVSIYSTKMSGGYKTLSGTSMAAPHISGMVSLLKSKYQSITTNEIKALFKSHGVQVHTDKPIGTFVIPEDVIVVQSMDNNPSSSIGNNVYGEEIATLNPNIQPLPDNSFVQDEIQVINLNPNGEVHPASDDENFTSVQEVVEKDPFILDPIRLSTSGDVLPTQSEDEVNTTYTPLEDIVFPTSLTGETIPGILPSPGDLIAPTVETTDNIFSGSTVQATIVQDVVLQYNQTFSYAIPDGKSKIVSLSTPVSTSVAKFYSSSSYFMISSQNLEAQFQVTLKDGNGNITNIFNVTITPTTYNIVMQMGSNSITSYGGQTFYTYRNFQSSNQGIVNISTYSSFYVIGPKTPGDTIVTAYDGSRRDYVLNIKVIPMPTPVDCTIVEQQKCEIEIPTITTPSTRLGFGESLSVSSPYAYVGVFESGTRKGVYVQGKMQGVTQVIVKDYTGYVAIINVTITLKPIPQERWCTVKSLSRCDVELLNARYYTYTFSQAGIISVSVGDNYLAVYGQGIGKTDLYIKRDGVVIATVHYTVWPINTHTTTYTFTTGTGANYLNISPVLYGHSGQGNLTMKSTLLTMKLKRVSDGVEIPIKNSIFFGTAASTGVSQNWIGDSATGWYANLSTGASATLGNDRLTLSITGNNGYAELRNTSGDYWGVTPDSIPVSPNTQYTLEYNYYVEYISGDADGGWTVKLYTQESDGVPAGEFQAQGYVKNPNAGGTRYMDISLNTYTLNLEVGQTGYIDVLSGNLGYSVAKNNTNVNVYASSGGGYQMQVVAVANGTSIVEITDSVGKKAQVQVNIGTQTTTSSSSSSGGGSTGSGSTSTGTTIPPTTTGLNALGSLQYMDYEYISDIDFAYIYFAVDGQTNGGGIEYKDASGNITTETIPNPGDSKYFAAFQKGTYVSFSPYYYTKTGVKVYYKSKTYLPFDNTINVQEDTFSEIQSDTTAYRCQVGNSGIFWTRPFNATCVDATQGIAWECKDTTLYKDLNPDGKGINSCILKTYYNGQYILDKTKIDAYISKIRNIKITDNITKIENGITMIQSIQSRIAISPISSNSKEYLTIILDDLRNELDKKISPQRKKSLDVLSWFHVLVISANSGGWGDGYIEEYTGKSRADIDQYAQRFAEEMFEYQYSYDPVFKSGHDTRVAEEKAKQEAIFGILTAEQKAQIEQGVKDGVISGTRDYVMQYYDLAQSLSSLKFDDVYNGVKNTWSFVASSVTNLSAMYESFKTSLNEIYTNLTALSGYQYSKGGSYIGTNVSLSSFDPTNKLILIAGSSFFLRLKKYTNLEIFNLIKDIRVNQAARDHILSRHKFGAGIPGKTEFPQSWTDTKIENSVNNIILDDTIIPFIQPDGKIRLDKTIESIDIRVIVDGQQQRVVTAFPTNTPENPLN